ncbi:hypothetical protein HPB50_029614 [Hyalomma asiaticum]|nr:hypothetical protein HPB50_029614 [Hyalomma asiaticum]
MNGPPVAPGGSWPLPGTFPPTTCLPSTNAGRTEGCRTTGGTNPTPETHTESSNSSTDTAVPSNLDPTEWPTLPQARSPPVTSSSRTTPREPVASSGSPSSTGSSDSSPEESFFSDSSSERSDPESEASAAPPAVTTATQTSPVRVRASSAPPTNRCPFSWETSFAFPTRGSRPADAFFLSQPGLPTNAVPSCLPASLSQPQATAGTSAAATTSAEDTAPFPQKQPASLQLSPASTECSTSEMHEAPSFPHNEAQSLHNVPHGEHNAPTTAHNPKTIEHKQPDSPGLLSAEPSKPRLPQQGKRVSVLGPLRPLVPQALPPVHNVRDSCPAKPQQTMECQQTSVCKQTAPEAPSQPADRPAASNSGGGKKKRRRFRPLDDTFATPATSVVDPSQSTASPETILYTPAEKKLHFLATTRDAIAAYLAGFQATHRVRVNLRRNVVAVDTIPGADLRPLTSVERICDVPVRVRVLSRNSCEGLLFGVDPDIDIVDVARNIESPAAPVLSCVRRGDCVVIQFSGTSPPDEIALFKQRRPVRARLPRPLQCERCGVYGHATATCSRDVRCLRCGGGHVASSCSAPKPRCINCRGQHPSTEPRCPVWQRERKAAVLLAGSDRRPTRREALARVSAPPPPPQY